MKPSSDTVPIFPDGTPIFTSFPPDAKRLAKTSAGLNPFEEGHMDKIIQLLQTNEKGLSLERPLTS